MTGVSYHKQLIIKKERKKKKKKKREIKLTSYNVMTSVSAVTLKAKI